ncbi:MAG: UbiX family flavin prenyltransferase [Thermoplasmata archaeon]|nr:MAG: UbiX family flavin prenyltransferase [Thermoplasmata archaeon]
MKIVVAITGASGAIYGIRLLEELKKRGHELHLIMSENAKKIIEYETPYEIEDIVKKANEFYDENDMQSKLASGSFIHDAMIICPCSIKTIACIANGIALNLIARAAVCCLKERRKLIVVPRETPLELISLENMVKLSRAGVIILPAMPAFYHRPKKVDDVVNYIVGKILEQLDIEHELYEKWK